MTATAPSSLESKTAGHSETARGFHDFILLSGVVLAPMTAARVGKVGPAEALIAAWAVISLVSGRRHRIRAADSLFWTFFLACMVGGTLVGIRLTPDDTEPLGLATWCYFAFISLVLVTDLSARPSRDLERLLQRIAIASTLWYGGLYLWALFVSSSFLGAPLWFAAVRFSGGGTNPHQVSLLLGAVAAVHLRRVIVADKLSHRLRRVPLLLVAVLTGLATLSSTLTVAMVASLVVGILVALREFGLTGRDRFLVVVALSILGVLASGQIQSAARRFIESDQNGEGRIVLWQGFQDFLNISPLIGLGPGTHARQGASEFHNSFLDLWSIAGLIGLVAFLAYMAHVLLSLRTDPTLLVVACALLTYGVAGFSVRRLVFWTILMLALALARSLSREKQDSVDDRRLAAGVGQR